MWAQSDGTRGGMPTWNQSPEGVMSGEELQAWLERARGAGAQGQLRQCNCSEEAMRRAFNQGVNDAMRNVSHHPLPTEGLVLRPTVLDRGRLVIREFAPWETRTLPEEWATVANVAGYVGIMLGVLGLLRLLCRCRWPLWWRQEKASAAVQEKVSVAVQEKLMGFKAGQLRLLVRMACCLLMPINAWVPWLKLPYAMQCAPVVSLAQNVLGLLTLFPSAISARSLDLVFCGLALLVTAAVTPATCSEEELLPTLLLANCLMLALVAVRRTTASRCPLLLLLSLLYGASSSGTIMRKGWLFFGEKRWHMAAAQAVFALLLAAAGPLLERVARARMLEYLELQEVKELLGASQSLLRSCFDVVVELDAGGRVVSKGPELGALLLKESSRQCLEGASFLELLEDELEREALAARFAEPAAAAGVAESMQLSMRDACQNSLRLEAMWFGFSRLGDQGSERRLMMGLRESGEQMRKQRELPAAVVGLDGRSGDEQLPVALSLSASSSLHEDAASSGSSHVDGGAMLLLDCGHGDFTVLKTSAAFQARVARVPSGRPLRRMMPQRNRAAFEDWLEEALALRRSGLPAPRDRRVTFEAPQGKVRARCRALPATARQQAAQQLPLLFYGFRMVEEQEGGRARPLANRGTSPRSSSASLEDGESEASASVKEGESKASSRRQRRGSRQVSRVVVTL